MGDNKQYLLVFERIPFPLRQPETRGNGAMVREFRRPERANPGAAGKPVAAFAIGRRGIPSRNGCAPRP